MSFASVRQHLTSKSQYHSKAMSAQATMEDFPIIDSHIHLFAASHISRLNWSGGLPQTHILNRQYSVDQYREATKTCQRLRGFVFVETDRKSGLDEDDWEEPLAEIAFLARIAQGKPIDGEGHASDDSSLVLGIVPWAPLPAGPVALQKYVARARHVCVREETFSLIKGFRYLLQDKPLGTMLEPDFIAGVQWLGEHDFSFDLGIDFRQAGIHQMEEACTLLERACRHHHGPRTIIDHFCKPDFRLTAEEAGKSELFLQWSACIARLARCPQTFMKLSGFFSELPPQDTNIPADLSEMVARVRPWIEVVFQAFGPSRIMFGSDWPVCVDGGPGPEAWQHWVKLVVAILDEQHLSHEEKTQIWALTATQAYGIELDNKIYVK